MILKGDRFFCQENGSDKEYLIQMEADGPGTFRVDGYNGRRGNATTLQAKGSGLTFAQAQAAYAAEVKNRAKKKYTLGESHVTEEYVALSGGDPSEAVVATTTASLMQAVTKREDTGFRPQLLVAVDVDEIGRYVADDDYVLLEKKNGVRCEGEHRPDGDLVFSTKLGFATSVPVVIRDAFADLPAGVALDGERIGDVLHVFDALSSAAGDMRRAPFVDRHAYAARVVAADTTGALAIVPFYEGREAKAAAAQRMQDENAEGLVFRRKRSPYTPGDRTDDAVKCKFVKTASFIVLGENARRSVRVAVLDAGAEVFVGNVTIPKNHAVPPAGAIVEVAYLHANRGGCIEQSVYLGQRDDVERAECDISQLVYVRKAA